MFSSLLVFLYLTCLLLLLYLKVACVCTKSCECEFLRKHDSNENGIVLFFLYFSGNLEYLDEVKQGDHSLPAGPMLVSTSSVLQSFKLEV
jgi:hypothetical protein